MSQQQRQRLLDRQKEHEEAMLQEGERQRRIAEIEERIRQLPIQLAVHQSLVANNVPSSLFLLSEETIGEIEGGDNDLNSSLARADYSDMLDEDGILW